VQYRKWIPAGKILPAAIVPILVAEDKEAQVTESALCAGIPDVAPKNCMSGLLK
jgi:hypothetical protein